MVRRMFVVLVLAVMVLMLGRLLVRVQHHRIEEEKVAIMVGYCSGDGSSWPVGSKMDSNVCLLRYVASTVEARRTLALAGR